MDGVQGHRFGTAWLSTCTFLSYECRSFVMRLLHVQVDQITSLIHTYANVYRYASQQSIRMSVWSMKRHPWMEGVDWAALRRHSPYRTPASGAEQVRSTLCAADVNKIVVAEKNVGLIPIEKQKLFQRWDSLTIHATFLRKLTCLSMSSYDYRTSLAELDRSTMTAVNSSCGGNGGGDSSMEPASPGRGPMSQRPEWAQFEYALVCQGRLAAGVERGLMHMAVFHF